MTYQDINQVANQLARVLITRAKIAGGNKEPQVCPLLEEDSVSHEIAYCLIKYSI